MTNYTNSEMADMHFVYGRANGNGLKARRLYSELYPDRIVPHHGIFARIHQRLREDGSFSRSTVDCGRSREVRTAALEEAVLNSIEESPRNSTRRIAQVLNVSSSTVFRILKEQLLYPYHIQRVQALSPRDFLPRLIFCQWMLQMITETPQFLSRIFFTDEANFSRQSIRNFHNNHVWAEENPHEIAESHFQHQFSLNVWLAVIDNFLIGPFFLPIRLSGDAYCHFLEEELPLLLEDVPIRIRQEKWYMHDGAPAHFSINARRYLDEFYPNRWIGRGGPQHWPARSPDLNPLDFCIWGYLKMLVYSTPVENIDDLRNRIMESCDVIRNNPHIFERIRNSLRKRLESCILSEGGHFQHLL